MRYLPVLINCWNNVVRWNCARACFCATAEFLWQEGHHGAWPPPKKPKPKRFSMLKVYTDFAVKRCRRSR